MTLSSEIVNFCWLCLINDFDEAVAVDQVSVVQHHLSLNSTLFSVVLENITAR